MVKAVFPGSFDPITLGHCDIINRAVVIFDEIIVAIGINTTKKSYFSTQEKLNFIKETFKDQPGIKVETYKGLTIDFCKKNNANCIIRGFRSVTDFEYENTIACMNKQLAPGIDTLCLFSSPQYSHINASVVREIIKMKGKADGFVPPAVIASLKKR